MYIQLGHGSSDVKLATKSTVATFSKTSPLKVGETRERHTDDIEAKGNDTIGKVIYHFFPSNVVTDN